jgi:F-type H+-transporting ATPase subunit epsilon
MSLKVIVYIPNRIVCNILTNELYIPVEIGHFAIQKSFQKHRAAISVGLLRIKNDNKWTLFLVFGGIVEVVNDNVTIFLNDAQEIRSTDNLDFLDLEKQLNEKRKEKCKTAYDKMQNLLEISRLRGLLQSRNYF